MDNFVLQMLKDALTIAAEDGKGRISLAPDGHVCFVSNRIGSGVAEDWIEPEAFMYFLHRVRDRADMLLDGL